MVRMSNVVLAFVPLAGRPRAIPADIRIPMPPFGIPTPPAPSRLARDVRPREPAWREAMRWSLIGLSASMAAGEVALMLFGP